MKTLLARALELEAGPHAAEEKRELLARLLSRLAHEIRNPLSSLDIHFQLLAEDLAQLPESLRLGATGRIDLLRGELHRLETIVQQFLRLAGPSEVDLEQTDPARLLRHVKNLLEPEAAQRQIQIEIQLPEPPIRLTVDPGQLTQALINLVINAIQAVGERGRIGLRLQAEPQNGIALFEVTDTGPGIPPERLGRIFEPFFTTKEEGGGLGLWIVQQIVSAHGGTVRAANRAQGGASFEIRLPLEPAGRASHG